MRDALSRERLSLVTLQLNCQEGSKAKKSDGRLSLQPPKMAKACIEKPRSSALNPLKFRSQSPPAEAGGKEEPAEAD
jgi:hypothetical protein